MTDHYFENDLVKLHYYKFGNGPKPMLCFHGYGMHGKQFRLLEVTLGDQYTFYGFDLFFHKETKLRDQSLSTIKKGITKSELADMISEFCTSLGIGRFSVIGYSMGSHYATVVVEEMPERIDEYIIAAPSSVNPGRLITFFSKNKIGNRIMEKLVLHEKALVRMLKLFKGLHVINDQDYRILYAEIGTPELRFNFYACFVYLRFFKTDEEKLLAVLNGKNIKSIFIFGKRDKSFPPRIGDKFIPKVKGAELVLLNEGHEMIKKDFAAALTKLLS